MAQGRQPEVFTKRRITIRAQEVERYAARKAGLEAERAAKREKLREAFKHGIGPTR